MKRKVFNAYGESATHFCNKQKLVNKRGFVTQISLFLKFKFKYRLTFIRTEAKLFEGFQILKLDFNQTESCSTFCCGSLSKTE